MSGFKTQYWARKRITIENQEGKEEEKEQAAS
jgi:hypothetical protein